MPRNSFHFPDKNRFSVMPSSTGRLNLEKMFRAHASDPPEEKYTLEEAKVKLTGSGFVVMRQKAFDEIIDEKYGKGFSKGKEEGSKEAKPDETLKSENETLKAEIEELKKAKPDLISKAEHEKLLQVERDKYSELDGEKQSLLNKIKEGEIFKAAAGSVDPETVVALLKDKFKIDKDGTVYPVDDKGERLIGKEGHITSEGFINDFLKSKPHLAKDASAPGTGSTTTGQGGKPAATGKYSTEELANLSFDEYAKAGGVDALGK